MPNTVCWMCRANTGHTRIANSRVVNYEVASADPSAQLMCAPFECQVCKGISIGFARTHPSIPMNQYFDTLAGSEIFWKPAPGESQAYADVPAPIAEAATEAYECHSDGHYRASILLARAVIEATAKNENITRGNLRDKIDELENQNLIRPHIKEVAHSIRLLGNDMAHGDFVVPVTAEESTLVIELMGEILNEVYQSPAKLQAVQQALAARQAQGGQQH